MSLGSRLEQNLDSKRFIGGEVSSAKITLQIINQKKMVYLGRKENGTVKTRAPAHTEGSPPGSEKERGSAPHGSLLY